MPNSLTGICRFLSIVFVWLSCTHSESSDSQTNRNQLPVCPQSTKPDTLVQRKIDSTASTSADGAAPIVEQDSATAAELKGNFVELITLDSTFVLDMKYATPDNFLKAKVYDCDKCLLRKEVAEALTEVQLILREKGYRIKLFDCYRPLDVQKKMWEIMPDDRYVGNPYGNGSVHNKGGAVDLTLIDENGKELDMGTPFDHFGQESHHAYRNLPATVLERRQMLKAVMENAGFSPITSEWWHYSYKKKYYPVSNFKPKC